MCQFIICYRAKLLKLGTMELGIQDDVASFVLLPQKRNFTFGKNMGPSLPL
jgi:hypothetical protein